MSQAFTPEQMLRIRNALFESACRYAVHQGVKKTSLEMLTADAGISKSTFYKFYASKERLFLEVGRHFENAILEQTRYALKQTAGQSSKQRTAAAVNAAFDQMTQLGATRFLKEDLPLLCELLSPDDTMQHFKGLSLSVFEALRQEGIVFSVPDEIVCSVIHILFLSMRYAREAEDFPNALRELVLGACERVVG